MCSATQHGMSQKPGGKDTYIFISSLFTTLEKNELNLAFSPTGFRNSYVTLILYNSSENILLYRYVC